MKYLIYYKKGHSLISGQNLIKLIPALNDYGFTTYHGLFNGACKRFSKDNLDEETYTATYEKTLDFDLITVTNINKFFRDITKLFPEGKVTSAIIDRGPDMYRIHLIESLIGFNDLYNIVYFEESE